MKPQRPWDVIRGPIAHGWTIAPDNSYLGLLLNPLLGGTTPGIGGCSLHKEGTGVGHVERRGIGTGR